MSEHYRLADVIGALSVVADLGFGLPPLQAVRSSLISAALARHLGVGDDDLQASFYAPLLMHVGCISMAHETAALYGNEIAITRAVAMTNLADPDDIVAKLVPVAARELQIRGRQDSLDEVMDQADDFGKHFDTASSEVARQTAGRIGLPEHVQTCLYEVDEAWQGGGAPRGLVGEDIALPARITRLASDAAYFNNLGGTGLAIEAIRARAGTLHDPDLAQAFIAEAEKILEDANAEEPATHLTRAEPDPVIEVDRTQLMEVAAAFGDAADLKTPYTHGHSGATAQLALAAGEHVGLDGDAIEALRLAAFLHDVGRVAVSNAVWEKAGSLNSTEWEEVRVHAYQAERILGRSDALAGRARSVGMHHERLDGSGYHRGSRGTEIPMEARLLAVADAWAAMQQHRPHRPALDPESSAANLHSEVKEGRLDPAAVTAVLEVVGRPASPSRVLPAGLSSREVEVLRLVAAGLSNPEIAGRLHISRRTAEHHVQHIYTKIGLATRPGAAMFALQHGLLEPIGH
ncbi:MAG TPA: HD domain-containing phosphohydrolase [Actinomycetota bacterium]|nr:HD domain-containing phosphohydrolase [Actinomycetota bacterium]